MRVFAANFISSRRLGQTMAAVLCAFAISAHGQDTSGSAERKVQQAAEALNRGWLVSSRKLLEEASAINPEAPGLKFQRALQELSDGHPRRAAAFARASLVSKQKVADSRTLLGLIALRDKDYAEAERQMREAVAAEPENGRSYYNLSEVLRWQGKPREALSQLEIAAKKQPNDPVLPLKIRLVNIEIGDRLTFVKPKADDNSGNTTESPSWVLTEAALALKGGKIDKAADLLEQARIALPPEFFYALLAEDHFFQTYKSEPALSRFYSKK